MRTLRCAPAGDVARWLRAVLASILIGNAAIAQHRLSTDAIVEWNEQQIEEALGKRGSVHFVEMPLRDVAEELSKQFQIPIVLQLKKLEEASVSADAPVTAHLGTLSLESILGLVLQNLELTYTIRSEVLLITTPEDEESQLEMRVYPVLDLVTERKAGSNAYVGNDFDSLIELITSTIKQNSWDDVGGPGAIDSSDNAGSLVISQTLIVHRQVERLLASLRRAKRIQGIPSLSVPASVSRRGSVAETNRAVVPPAAEAAPSWQLPQVYR